MLHSQVRNVNSFDTWYPIFFPDRFIEVMTQHKKGYPVMGIVYGNNNSKYFIIICKTHMYLLEVYFPYDPVCPSFGRSVGRLVGRSVIISEKGLNLHFHAPIKALNCSCRRYS